MIPYKFKGKKCILFSIVYYTVLYSPLKVCCIFLSEAIKGLMYFADSRTGLVDSRTELETAFNN